MNPYVEILTVSFIWGLSGTFVKILHLPSTTLTFFRVAVPTIILYIYLSMKKTRLFRGNIKFLLLASFLNAVRLLLYYMAYNFATIGNATLALSTTAIFICIFSAIFLKEKMTMKKILLIFMGFAGLCVLYSGQPISFHNKDFIGMCVGLVSTAMYAATVVIFKHELERFSKTETVFYQNVVGAFVFLPFLFINHPFPAVWQISLASFSALIIGLIAFVLYFSALKRVNATASSLAMVDSVINVLFGVILFHEHLTPTMIAGGLIIFLTSIIISGELRKT